MRPDENSRKPEQINQSIIDDTQVGRDLNIETVNQSITINNPSNENKPRLRAFQAPPTPEYYVDRPEVSRDLKQRLLADGGTLVISAIHGLGSVGKSTLAAALAHDADIQKHFCDGILWATLGQEPDVLSLLGGWVQGLGDYNYRATSIEATSAHLNTLLFDKAVLLVVDDAWIDESNGWEPVQAFKVGGDRTRMLVTTRDASIANFLGASTFSLDVMTKTQALELLTKKVEKQGKQLKQEEIKSAQALAKAVGYLPLALELAAAQVASSTSWQDLTKDIKQEIARLKSFQDPGIRNISNDEKFKKLSLQASLNLSIKRLEENDREYFAWLGVLPEDASITPKMTATLWDMDERDAEETLQYLRSQALLLTGVFLADGTATYRLHDLFHDLARNLLTEPQKPKRRGDLIGLGMKWEDVHAQLLDKYQQQTENNLWYTLPDDGYIHQHLVWHLEKAGKIEEIHQLLREESASGNNGWYEVRERFGQTAGFLTDVAKAWELAETDWEKKNLSYVINLQYRYGLMITSLNSLAANIPTQLIVAFVKNEFWYPEQGLAYALQKKDAQDKASSLTALADCLPEALKEKALKIALEAAHQISNEYHSAQTILTIAKKIPDEDLYNQTLKKAPQLHDKKYLAQPLTNLVKNLKDENSYLQALEDASRRGEYARTQILLSLAKNLPENLYSRALEVARYTRDRNYRVQILTALAQKLPKDLCIQTLEAARLIQDSKYHDQVIFNIASNIASKLQDENLYREAIETARQIKDEKYRAKFLIHLAQRLQDQNLYREAIETARQIKDKQSRTKVLIDLGDKLQDQKLYREAIETARKIKDKQSRTKFLIDLAERLQDQTFYHEIIGIACKIKDEQSRTKFLIDLAERLQDQTFYRVAIELARQFQSVEDSFSRNHHYFHFFDSRDVIISYLAKKLPKNLCYEAIEIVRQIKDKKSRTKVLIDLAEKLQDKNLYHEAIETAHQIQSLDSRAKVLIDLAEKLQDKNLYHEATETARQIQSLDSRAKILIDLAEKLQDKNFYHEAIETAHQIQSLDSREKVLIDLAEKLQDKNFYHEATETARQIQSIDSRDQILSNLAKKLEDENFYSEAIKTARQIQLLDSRDQILSGLAQKLPENLYREAIETARQIQSEYYRAEALKNLAEKLEDENLYREAIETARQIKNEKYLAEVLSSSVEKLPENLYREAIDIARQIKNEKYRAEILSNLGQKLPANLYHEVIDIARQIRNEYYRVQILLAVVKNISLKRPINKIFSVWQEILQLSSRLEREKFQQIIQELIPVISQLGGKEALTEVATAIQDVSRWWR